MTQSRLVYLERTLLVVILATSLILRLTGLDSFSIADEALWHYRSIEFDKALESRQWQYTYQTGHPGVVTMWLGAIANRVEWLQRPQAWDHDAVRVLLQSFAPAPGTGVPPVTLGARRLVALVTWLSIVALYPLLRRLFERHIALCATALVALDPFFLAHSRIHHLDALLTAFVMLSVVSLLVYRFRSRSIGYLLASAATAGLAIANKSPGVFLLPWAGLVLVLPVLWKTRSLRHREVWRAAGVWCLWVLAAVLLIVAIWPVLWVRPLATLQNVLGVAQQYAENPHSNSNFFWFAVRPDPGLGFYPVAWAFRTTPWVLLGVVALVTAWRERTWRAVGVMLLLWALLFAAAMTTGEKKFDRYLLPVFPLLDILAAVGWVALAHRCLSGPRWKQWLPPALIAALATGQFLVLWPGRPYYLSCYNPALGGARTAPRVMLIGWGEGLDRAAAYLNAKPDARELVVSSWHRPELGDYFVGQTFDKWKPDCLANADYFVLYSNVAQRELMAEAARRFVAEQQPEYVVSFNGIDYAAIYENRLYRQAEEETISRIAGQGDAGAQVVVVEGNAPLARGYAGPVPLVELTGPSREDTIRTALQQAAAGCEHIWQLVYPDSAECDCGAVAEQLGRYATVGETFEVGGVQAVRYDLPDGPRFVTQPAVAVEAHLGESIALEGYDMVGALVPGQPFRLQLHWRTDAPLDISYTVFAHLVGPDGSIVTQADSLPQGGAAPTTAWEPGQVILDEHVFNVPTDAPQGAYSIAVGLYDLVTMERLPVVDRAGQHLPDGAVVFSGLQAVADQ